MGVFDWLFGKKGDGAADAAEAGKPANAKGAVPKAIKGTPEFVRAAEMQRTYWTHNLAEQKTMEAKTIAKLDWRERLRLHHLYCMQRVIPGAPQAAAAAESTRQIVRRLAALDSPYRARRALVWHGQATQATDESEPDKQGHILNPSLTHLGCLEIYRLDGKNQPKVIDFVSFDELSAIELGPPNMLRTAKLLYDDGRKVSVVIPLLYGLTWTLGTDQDREGKSTRFVSHLEGIKTAEIWASGIGIGQQDLSIRTPDGRPTMFGMGTVGKVSFPLDVTDPRFDQKARARGIDPAEVRRRMQRNAGG